MTAAAGTVSIIDGTGATITQRVLDESGTGAGPNQTVVNAARFDGGIIKSEWNYAAAAGGISNTTTAVTIAAAAGASLRNYVESIDFSWSGLTNATEICIRDGAGGTVLWRQRITAANSTATLNVRFARPIKGSVNTLLEVVTLTAMGAGSYFYFNASGFVAA